jgi:hypothetical protein
MMCCVVMRCDEMFTAKGCSNASNPCMYVCVFAGADLFLRPAYVPSMQTHRMRVLSPEGRLLSGSESERAAGRAVTIAGPLCHSTDFLAKELAGLPEPEVGDWVLVLDCGGNTLSTFSKHCSRQAPPVFAFRKQQQQQEQEQEGEGEGVIVVEIKQEESELGALDFWN